MIRILFEEKEIIPPMEWPAQTVFAFPPEYLCFSNEVNPEPRSHRNTPCLESEVNAVAQPRFHA